LHWVRGADAQGCIDGRELSRRVEAKLHRPVFEAPRDAELIVEGAASRSGQGYRAELRTFDAQGTALGSREVLSERESCDELSETVAVVLAVMIDPAGALNPPVSEPEGPAAPAMVPPPVDEPPPLAPPPCPVVAAPEVPPVTAPPRPAARRARPELSGFARVDLGHLPEPIVGGGLAFELRLPRWGGLRLEGSVFAERAVHQDGPPQAGVDVRVLYAGASYCPLWRERGRLRGTACAGVAAGALQGRGFGFDASHESTSPLLDGLVDLRGALRLWKGLGLYAGAGLSVPFTRTTLMATLADRSEVTLFHQPSLAGHLDLGLGTTF